MSRKTNGGLNPLAPALDAKTKTGANEFAFKIGAAFNFVKEGTIVTVKPDGTIAVTLNFALDNPADNKFGANADISKDDTAVFNTATDNYFNAATVSKLSIGQDADTRIILQSDQNDITLTTNGEKGRQGDA